MTARCIAAAWARSGGVLGVRSGRVLPFHNEKRISLRKTLLLRIVLLFRVAECTNELCNMTVEFVYNPRRVNIHHFMHVFGAFMHKKEAVYTAPLFTQFFNFCFYVVGLNV